VKCEKKRIGENQSIGLRPVRPITPPMINRLSFSLEMLRTGDARATRNAPEETTKSSGCPLSKRWRN